jgi:hypothetical protein
MILKGQEGEKREIVVHSEKRLNEKRVRAEFL